jgi:hypothetical protein
MGLHCTKEKHSDIVFAVFWNSAVADKFVLARFSNFSYGGEKISNSIQT